LKRLSDAMPTFTPFLAIAYLSNSNLELASQPVHETKDQLEEYLETTHDLNRKIYSNMLEYHVGLHLHRK